MQRCVLFCASGVTADQMQRGDRDVQFGVISVGEHQIFTFDPARFQRGHPGIASNAVLQMHHGLTRMQLCQVADQRIRVNRAARILTTARHALAQQVAFTNECQMARRIDKPVLGGANHQVASSLRRVIQTHNALRRDFDSGEQFTQRFTTAFTLNRENHRPVEGLEEFAQRIQW